MEKQELINYYYKLLNIKQNQTPFQTIMSIVQNNNELIEDKIGMCKVLANNISLDLTDQSIKNKVINTKDFNSPYEHTFIICFYQDQTLKCLLIDPSYIQFLKQEGQTLNKPFLEWPSEMLNKTPSGKELLQNLLINGFSQITDSTLKEYLQSLMATQTITLEEILLNTKTRSY